MECDDCPICDARLTVYQGPGDRGPVFYCFRCNTRYPEMVVPINVLPLFRYQSREAVGTLWLC